MHVDRRGPGALEGTTELPYRSVYVFARRHGAENLVAAVDPMTLDVFREEYGILFRALGPITTRLGFDSLTVGEEMGQLEAGLRPTTRLLRLPHRAFYRQRAPPVWPRPQDGDVGLRPTGYGTRPGSGQTEQVDRAGGTPQR
ncbi:MAG: hypothetical protein IPH29_19415 [Candidatus Microthrix sp.]|nr:hypothetical protein [Candidatus Microthrix sp.]